MVRTLLEGGWPHREAVARASIGKPCLVYDDGDDHTIEIREI